MWRNRLLNGPVERGLSIADHRRARKRNTTARMVSLSRLFVAGGH